MYAIRSDYPQRSFFKRIYLKLLKIIIQHFPSNSFRIKALRLSGFSVGSHVYIGQDLIVASPISEKSCNLIIGNRVAIGPRVTIVLSSDANWSKLMENREYIKSTIELGDDCWIGANVVLLPGVKIGTMSIIGAGAVVTKDIPDYSIAYGVPARVMGTVIDEKRKTI